MLFEWAKTAASTPTATSHDKTLKVGPVPKLFGRKSTNERSDASGSARCGAIKVTAWASWFQPLGLYLGRALLRAFLCWVLKSSFPARLKLDARLLGDLYNYTGEVEPA